MLLLVEVAEEQVALNGRLDTSTLRGRLVDVDLLCVVRRGQIGRLGGH